MQTAARRFLASQIKHGKNSFRINSSLFLPATSSLAYQVPQRCSYSSSPREELTTNVKVVPPKVVDIKKQLWEFYLSTGRGANALFEAIDLDENGAIEPEELKKFMLEVMGDEDPREIMPYAWNRLEQRAAAKQQYDIKHFKKWLVAATKMSADMKNSRILAYLQQNPNTGDQDHNKLPHERMDGADDGEPAVYTWNEETMSQSLRRMQYAVRGEVSRSVVLFNTVCQDMYTAITFRLKVLANVQKFLFHIPLFTGRYAGGQTRGRRPRHFVHQHWESPSSGTVPHYLLSASLGTL